ncbi:MAG: hypothetical protein ABJ360_17125 [Roseobacter sp.]
MRLPLLQLVLKGAQFQGGASKIRRQNFLIARATGVAVLGIEPPFWGTGL